MILAVIAIDIVRTVISDVPSLWRLLLFGLALIVMMRIRPEGLLPSTRVKLEFHNAE